MRHDDIPAHIHLVTRTYAHTRIIWVHNQIQAATTMDLVCTEGDGDEESSSEEEEEPEPYARHYLNGGSDKEAVVATMGLPEDGGWPPSQVTDKAYLFIDQKECNVLLPVFERACVQERARACSCECAHVCIHAAVFGGG